MTEDKLESSDERKSASLRWLFVLIASVLALQVGMWWLITSFKMEATPELGQFGDMFGAINTLFSGLAFAGIIYTILLQRNELSLQRKELQDTREELKLTREAHQQNCDLMTSQLRVLERAAEREQVLFDRQFLPVFVAGRSALSEDRKIIEKTIINKGNAVRNVMIMNSSHSGGKIHAPTESAFLDGNHSASILCNLQPRSIVSSEYQIFYQTLDGRLWETEAELTISPDNYAYLRIGQTKPKEINPGAV